MADDSGHVKEYGSHNYVKLYGGGLYAYGMTYIVMTMKMGICIYDNDALSEINCDKSNKAVI